MASKEVITEGSRQMALSWCIIHVGCDGWLTGVHLCTSLKDVRKNTLSMLGENIVTKQSVR